MVLHFLIRLCLIDTYDTIQSVLVNFIMVSLALDDISYAPKGISLDRGNLSSLSSTCDRVLKEYAAKTGRDFFRNLNIIVSNESLHELNQNGHAISMFGNLVTSWREIDNCLVEK